MNVSEPLGHLGLGGCSVAVLAGSQVWKRQSGPENLLHLPFARIVDVASEK